MRLALKSGPQIVAKVVNTAGLLCRRIWYSVGKSGVLGITEYRQGRPLFINTIYTSKCSNKTVHIGVAHRSTFEGHIPMHSLLVLLQG